MFKSQHDVGDASGLEEVFRSQERSRVSMTDGGGPDGIAPGAAQRDPLVREVTPVNDGEHGTSAETTARRTRSVVFGSTGRRGSWRASGGDLVRGTVEPRFESLLDVRRPERARRARRGGRHVRNRSAPRTERGGTGNARAGPAAQRPFDLWRGDDGPDGSGFTDQ